MSKMHLQDIGSPLVEVEGGSEQCATSNGHVEWDVEWDLLIHLPSNGDVECHVEPKTPQNRAQMAPRGGQDAKKKPKKTIDATKNKDSSKK